MEGVFVNNKSRKEMKMLMPKAKFNVLLGLNESLLPSFIPHCIKWIKENPITIILMWGKILREPNYHKILKDPA